METEADRKRDRIKEHVNLTIREIAELIADKYALEEYSQGYQETLSEVLTDLLRVRNKL